jgi:hypothetical protein
MNTGKQLLIFLVVSLAFCGCTGKNGSTAGVEKPVSVATPQPAQATATPFPKLPPPTQAEVESAIARVFSNVLSIDRSRRQNFIAGDFNGDGSEDLAVIVRPVRGRLDEINSELANWTIQDADNAFVPSPHQRVVKMEKAAPPKVAEQEAVLAIVHGFGPQGWRNSEARQAILVKHAAAVFQGTAPSISQKAIRLMRLPVETEIIRGLRGREKGFLFWTGGAYAWHPSER